MASIDMESKNIRLAQLHDAESIQLLLEQLGYALPVAALVSTKIIPSPAVMSY